MAKVVEITREQYDCLRELGVSVGTLMPTQEPLSLYASYLLNGGDAALNWYPSGSGYFSYRYVTLVDK